MKIPLGIWNEDRVEELKRLWTKGPSAGVIARLMGMTRNAILGKVHRLKLEPRSNRNGSFRGPEREAVKRSAPKQSPPKRTPHNSVFRAPERKPNFIPIDPNRVAPLMPITSPITGAFLASKRMRPAQPEYTKNELRAMLTQAVKNTVAKGVT